MVINAGRENILQSLKASGQVTTDDSQALHRATQALWIGSQADFSHSQLRSWFESDRVVPEIEQSEYDIFLVKIEMEKLDPGFQPNVPSIDRLDAFRRLAENPHEVKVSSRLSSQAYENMGFYK
ncbi:hypothetical protein F7734_48280 [Scytonema sp. UIC 10036]|uniref:hypothetical protein n=1 Tax=Scytonema sp. UIC 10036 TaxID=2304196 RepID=UPI0012DA4084|nr:hypothetical protein [Scytonema sp. UIC 10036]MUG99669.1 hypothetical protein [Scytonema sp. UIC 10036]